MYSYCHYWFGEFVCDRLIFAKFPHLFCKLPFIVAGDGTSRISKWSDKRGWWSECEKGFFKNRCDGKLNLNFTTNCFIYRKMKVRDIAGLDTLYSRGFVKENIFIRCKTSILKCAWFVLRLKLEYSRLKLRTSYLYPKNHEYKAILSIF